LDGLLATYDDDVDYVVVAVDGDDEERAWAELEEQMRNLLDFVMAAADDVDDIGMKAMRPEIMN